MNTRFAGLWARTPVLALASSIHCTRVAARPDGQSVGATEVGASTASENGSRAPRAVRPPAEPAKPLTPPAPFDELRQRARALALEPASERRKLQQRL